MQQQNNFFISMIKRYNGNENFITAFRPEQIQKFAKERIFREMVRGQIDYTVYGKYFLDPIFLENLIVVADSELKNNAICGEALGFYDMSFPGNPLVIYNKSKHLALANIYNVILSRLQNLKFSGNIGCLMDIHLVLKDYKNNI